MAAQTSKTKADAQQREEGSRTENTDDNEREPTATVAPTPGPRATQFQKIYSQALLHTIRTNSYANFAACFPTPAHHVPRSLESVWRQLNAKLEESARAEFADILKEREVVERLNELDRLVGEARTRRENGEGEDEPNAPLHTLGANELYQAHLTPYLARTQSSLDSKIDSVEKENVHLADKIGQQRNEIQQLLSRLNAVVGDINDAASSLREFESENHIRKEAENLDDDINANHSR